MVRLELRSVSRTERSFTLPPCSGDFSSGRPVTLFGMNGAGKTTLLRCMAGLVGHKGDIETVADSRIAVFDPPDFYHRMSCLDNLRLLLTSFPSSVDTHMLREALASAGLGDVMNVRVGHISTGQRKLLGFLLANLSLSDLVLLDEITEGVDDDGLAWMRERVMASCSKRLWFLAGHDRAFSASVGAEEFTLDERGIAPSGAVSKREGHAP